MNSAIPPDIRRLSHEELCRILGERGAPLRQAVRAEFRRRETALVRRAIWASFLLICAAAAPIVAATAEERPAAQALLAAR